MSDNFGRIGKEIVTVLSDIAKSLRIISGREDNDRRYNKPPKETYADKYFSKDK